jgi:glucose-1-phosphate cytidylyltransferase
MGLNVMKVIILAGGFGTRLSEYTGTVPKPMIPIGGKPILWHIMQTYSSQGYSDFLIALGYKAEVIKEYFLNYRALNSDFTVNLANGSVTPHQVGDTGWNVSLFDTGEQTMTGGRIKRLRDFIGNQRCMLTYGDGLADIDLNALEAFHLSHGKMITVSSVRPSARFGELELDGDRVVSFQEKPQLQQGWINGGFFVIEPSFFEYIEGDETMLEREPMERAAAAGELMAFRHEGFWHCMDTKRDNDLLQAIWLKGDAPWASKWTKQSAS